MSTTAYTAPAPAEPVAAKARRNSIWLLGFALMVAIAISVAVTQRPTDYRELSIDNSTANGSRAVAEILRRQGVTVTQTDTLARVTVTDPATTTLVIAGVDQLTEAQVTSVLAYRGDIVFIGASADLIALLDPGLAVTSSFLPQTVDAACADPDATAAERMRVEFTGLIEVGPTSAVTCFANRSQVFGMAVVDGNRTVLANPWIFRNDSLVDDGNAALAVRTTGHHQRVAWYVARWDDPTLLGGSGEPTDVDVTADFLPPGFGTALYALALAALVAAAWKGRRFGPLSVEPLPIVVRASEATRGRARLYRRARAHGRATAALRAAAAKRMAGRLGLPRTSTRDEVVATIASATGLPAASIARTLYGAPPRSDAEMIEIVDQLDALEGEVHSL